MFTDCRVTDGISLIKRISIWGSIKKLDWLLIQFQWKIKSNWSMCPRLSETCWIVRVFAVEWKFSCLRGWAAGKGRLDLRSREFWQFRVGAGSSTVAGWVLHQAWLKRVGLLWVVSMFVFLSDATPVVVLANTTWAAVALWGIPTSAAQCSFQTPFCCGCCGGGGDNDDDFFLSKGPFVQNAWKECYWYSSIIRPDILSF